MSDVNGSLDVKTVDSHPAILQDCLPMDTETVEEADYHDARCFDWHWPATVAYAEGASP